VKVYHHKNGFLGTVVKKGLPLFVPFGVEEQVKELQMPQSVMINPGEP